MVPVGVIGLSPAWETQYRPALKALRTRIAVRAVYDHVLSRAELAAADFGALPVAGMRALARRDDLKALLVFDTGWGGAETIRLLCSAGRPMFVAGTFSADEPELERLIESAVDCGSMVMPALGARYTPATCRLRELMASRLGRPLKIEIEANAPPDASRIVWLRVSANSTRLALKPVVLTLAMLFDTTSSINWWERSPETPENIERIMVGGLLSFGSGGGGFGAGSAGLVRRGGRLARVVLSGHRLSGVGLYGVGLCVCRRSVGLRGCRPGLGGRRQRRRGWRATRVSCP